MKKLTRYSSFEALKAAVEPQRAAVAKDEKRLAEFEEFLRRLQSSRPRQNVSTTDGK